MRVIAIQEFSAGNESVGNMWVEAQSFDASTPVSEIIKWAEFAASHGARGRLLLTIEKIPV